MLNIFPFFSTFAEFLLSPFQGSTKLQILVVMLIFPLIMNIIQAWLIDMVIKARLEVPIDEDLLVTDEETLLPRSVSPLVLIQSRQKQTTLSGSNRKFESLGSSDSLLEQNLDHK
jgi:hypothetical protein